MGNRFKKPHPTQKKAAKKSSLNKVRKPTRQKPTGYSIPGHPHPHRGTGRYPNSTSKTKPGFKKIQGIDFAIPDSQDAQFTPQSAFAATRPLTVAEIDQTTGGRAKHSGVKVGDVGSYGVIQHQEKIGDHLTGDHQPSGAAVKEAIREKLHIALNVVLTRSMAKNAYRRAITIVMTEAWHRADSRTYGGRNTPAQIKKDAADFAKAAMADWEKTVPGLKAERLSDREIQEIWSELEAARTKFFGTGNSAAAFRP